MLNGALFRRTIGRVPHLPNIFAMKFVQPCPARVPNIWNTLTAASTIRTRDSFEPRESIAGTQTLQTNTTLTKHDAGDHALLAFAREPAPTGTGLNGREVGAILAGGLALAFPAYLALMFHSHDWILAANGRPRITDFLVFWLAGHSALHGAAASAYVPTIHHAAEVAAAGRNFSVNCPGAIRRSSFSLQRRCRSFRTSRRSCSGLSALCFYMVQSLRESRDRALAFLVSCAAPAVFISTRSADKTGRSPLVLHWRRPAWLSRGTTGIKRAFAWGYWLNKPAVRNSFPASLWSRAGIGGPWDRGHSCHLGRASGVGRRGSSVSTRCGHSCTIFRSPLETACSCMASTVSPSFRPCTD